MPVIPTTLSFQEQLHLQNRVTAAEFGIERIIDPCHANIKMYQELGLTGSATSRILDMAEAVKAQLDSRP